MKIYCLILFDRYGLSPYQLKYYLINANTREEAIIKFNQKYNLTINVNKLNCDDLKEIIFDDADVINISKNAFWDDIKTK